MLMISMVEAKELSSSSLYWVLEVDKGVKKCLEVLQVREAFRSFFGNTALEQISSLTDMLFSEAAEVCEDLRLQMQELDGGDPFSCALYNVFEDLCFHLSEVAATYRRVHKMLVLLTEDVTPEMLTYAMNDIGADIGGFRATVGE